LCGLFLLYDPLLIEILFRAGNCTNMQVPQLFPQIHTGSDILQRCMCYELLQNIDYARGFCCLPDPSGIDQCTHRALVADGVQVTLPSKSFGKFEHGMDHIDEYASERDAKEELGCVKFKDHVVITSESARNLLRRFSLPAMKRKKDARRSWVSTGAERGITTRIQRFVQQFACG